jgi:soluble lytic murein transglycosylase
VHLKSLLGVVLLLCPLATLAGDEDKAFREAREAFQRGDAQKLDRTLPQFAGHVLEPYLRYWQLRMYIDVLPADEIQTFLTQQQGSLIADRMRADWLRLLARRQDWESYLSEYAKLVVDEPELNCYALQGRIALGEPEALSAARIQWNSAQVQPESCMPLFRAMFDNQMLGVEDVWLRVRLALEAGNRAVAKSAMQYLPAVQRPDGRLFDTIARRPQDYLQRSPVPLKSRAQQELAIYALYKAAETWPQLAAQKLMAAESSLPEDLRDYAWGQVGMSAAWAHHPEALNWFRRARIEQLNDMQLAWRTRAALRDGDWRAVIESVDAMSPGERMLTPWRYWKARALSALGRQPEANRLLAPLSNEFNFYGQLAAEELGTAISVVPETYKPDASEVEAISRHPGLQRALALYAAGMRYEGALEWQWTIKDFDDKQLLAAAQLAQQNEWYERAIHTADRTELLHNFGLRFPAPYRDIMQSFTAPLDLDEAWVYGLIRQESRFVVTARSTAGAGGLMQLMPSTARWVAKRLGLKEHHSTLMDGVDTNLSLGTYYLKQMLDSADDQPIIASAAYNAGMRRAAQWRGRRALEGAVYAETVPFPETRNYVKNVMSNSTYYARLFRHTGLSLRDRLGTVPPRPTQNN